MPNNFIAFLTGQSLSWLLMLGLRLMMYRQSDMDKTARSRFALILTLNFLLGFVSLLFYSQSQGDSILWFGALFPIPHNYAKLSVFGITSHEWLHIAIAKFCMSIAAALTLAVFIYFLNYGLLDHYKVARSRVWATRLMLCFMFSVLLAAAIGCCQFVMERQG